MSNSKFNPGKPGTNPTDNIDIRELYQALLRFDADAFALEPPQVCETCQAGEISHQASEKGKIIDSWENLKNRIGKFFRKYQWPYEP